MLIHFHTAKVKVINQTIMISQITFDIYLTITVWLIWFILQSRSLEKIALTTQCSTSSSAICDTTHSLKVSIHYKQKLEKTYSEGMRITWSASLIAEYGISPESLVLRSTKVINLILAMQSSWTRPIDNSGVIKRQTKTTFFLLL